MACKIPGPSRCTTPDSSPGEEISSGAVGADGTGAADTSAAALGAELDCVDCVDCVDFREHAGVAVTAQAAMREGATQRNVIGTGLYHSSAGLRAGSYLSGRARHSLASAQVERTLLQ